MVLIQIIHVVVVIQTVLLVVVLLYIALDVLEGCTCIQEIILVLLHVQLQIIIPIVPHLHALHVTINV
jgi:hypothetical protein